MADEVIDIHRELPDQVALAQARHLAAVLLWTDHRPEQALHQLDRASDLARELGADHIRAAASHTRGVVELTRGLPVAAQSCFEACGAILTDLAPLDRGFFPAVSAGFSVEWDDGRPRVVFEETLVIGHRLDAGPAAAHLRFSGAWAARAVGDLGTAVACAEDSAAGFAAQRWDYGVALAQNLLGNLHRLAGELGAARRCLEHCLHLRTALRDRRATGVTLGGLGLLAAAEGDAAAAQRYLRQALELFERIEDG